MTLQIEEGAYYRRRDGEVVGPAIRTCGTVWQWELGFRLYKDNGLGLISGETPLDLLEKVDSFQSVNQQPKVELTAQPPVPDDAAGGDAVPAANAVDDLIRAVDVATTAASLVGGDRDRQHGAKLDNFNRIAAVWNAWLGIRKDPAGALTAHDVGVMMSLMKIARTQSGAFNIDDYIDGAGYLACAAEVAQPTG